MPAEGDDEAYNNSNKAFLQAFISRSTLTLEEAKPILAAIFAAQEGREILAEDVTEADFTSYVNAANHAISPLDLEIRSTLHQTTRQRVHALVNTTSDPATQLATAFTPDELGFVKRVMDDMFESNNSRRHEVMAVPTIYALKLHNKTAAGRRVSAHASAAANADGEATQGGGAQPITIMQAERVLQGLVDQGWFEKSRKAFVSLSPRALMELRGWFIETYNEPDDSDGEQASARPQKIKFCYACKEIVTVGQRCHTLDCGCRLHDGCAPQLFRAQKSKKCPLCKTDWSGKFLVGENAKPQNSTPKPQPRRSGASAAQRGSQAAQARTADSPQEIPDDESEDDDEDEDEDEDE